MKQGELEYGQVVEEGGLEPVPNDNEGNAEDGEKKEEEPPTFCAATLACFIVLFVPTSFTFLGVGPMLFVQETPSPVSVARTGSCWRYVNILCQYRPLHRRPLSVSHLREPGEHQPLRMTLG